MQMFRSIRFSPVGLLKRAVPCAVLAGALVGGPDVTDARPPRVARKLDPIDTPVTSRKSVLVEAVDIAKASQAELAKIKDYTCTFSKRELVGTKLQKATMSVKFRQEPLSVYMKFIEPSAGREVLYVAGQNDGKLLAHEGGFAAWAGTFQFAPEAPEVMKESRYPITKFGMANLVRLTIEIWQREAQYDEVQVRIGEGRFADIDCQVVEVIRPQARPEMKYHHSKLFFAKQSKLPVRIEHYAFPVRGRQPELIEEYSYTNVRTNVGLTDLDFDRKNSQYNF